MSNRKLSFIFCLLNRLPIKGLDVFTFVGPKTTDTQNSFSILSVSGCGHAGETDQNCANVSVNCKFLKGKVGSQRKFREVWCLISRSTVVRKGMSSHRFRGNMKE